MVHSKLGEFPVGKFKSTNHWYLKPHSHLDQMSSFSADYPKKVYQGHHSGLVLRNPGSATALVAVLKHFGRSSFRGREFIMNHLEQKDVSCYWEKLLKRYAKLMKWKPTKNKDLKQIGAKSRRDELWWHRKIRSKKYAHVKQTLTSFTMFTIICVTL